MIPTGETYSSLHLRERDKLLVERHQKELAVVERKVDKLKWSNTDLLKQLFDAQNRGHRLAMSLGFNDIYEAQVSIHNADNCTLYKDCIDGFDKLRSDLAKAESENVKLRDELRRVEEERDQAKANARAMEKSHRVNRSDYYTQFASKVLIPSPEPSLRLPALHLLENPRPKLSPLNLPNFGSVLIRS
jgi:chromosome segregation ATPase